MINNDKVDEFILRWRGVAASELATAQTFVMDLCDLLNVPKPHATSDQEYMFERPVEFLHGDGSTSPGRIDCYKRNHFVLEAKKVKASTHTKGFDDALLRARAQGEGYSRALPASEGRPPFVVVVDVGHVIELYAEFTLSGGTYTPFPDPRSHRIRLDDLRDNFILERLRTLWLDPMSLDPARANARVTREVASELAAVARSLETDGHSGHDVGAFLTRCLFSMFAEDVGLLPPSTNGDGAFTDLLKRHREDPPTLQRMLTAMWSDMDRGGFSAALAKDVLRFNGKLFKASGSVGYALLLRRSQIDGLLAASRASWKEVEPSIFGTLLERALDPTERHKLGAHYTPRSYVERLILPTVVEPLRAQWADAQAAALLLANEAAELESHPPVVKSKKDFLALDRHNAAVRVKWREAQQQVKNFHHYLCSVRILDPACGSGNFLYVTLEHLKRLEGEVLNQLTSLGEAQDALGFGGETVTLQQLLGIELNERAAALAELVLWIGFLQWHIRTFGNTSVAEPVVHNYGNIEHRDAVLAYDSKEPTLDASGDAITRWDGVTTKKHQVTGEDVPDDSVRAIQWRYINPMQAQWPAVDFIVGNPPFLGAGNPMRDALGDGYVEALRRAWPEVPESADFVMHWWHRAAGMIRDGQASRFGLITTNSLRQTFNRRVVQSALSRGDLSLVFAVPDHPWVDSTNGAEVRIAMTVARSGSHEGRLLNVTNELSGEHGEVVCEFSERRGLIHPDLRIGANVAGAVSMRANSNLSNRGVQLFGSGFIVTREQAASLGLGSVDGLASHIREYRNGRDLTGNPRNVLVIDMFGLSVDELRIKFPAAYQWLLERVKPERDQNNRLTYREKWWIFGEPRRVLRKQLVGLPRYIATVETAKHRIFQFLDAKVLPDNKLVAIALSDAYHLGVLSSSSHGIWALAAGSWLGVGNDPVYVKTRCFEAYPFPDHETGLTSELTQRIQSLGEQLDSHRKIQQSTFPDLKLTDIYNVLEKLRTGDPLTSSERTIHERGLVAVLRTIHDELDSAVLSAYGWSDLNLPSDTDTLLNRLVELNSKRANEEAEGVVRWLRPAFQQSTLSSAQTILEIDSTEIEVQATTTSEVMKFPWPTSLPSQIRIVADLLATSQQPLVLSAIEAHFTARGRWRDRLPIILETLEALGRVRRLNVSPERWQAA